MEYVNYKGETYELRVQAVTLIGGRKQNIYYFVKRGNVTKGKRCNKLPKGYQVFENPRTGVCTARLVRKV